MQHRLILFDNDGTLNTQFSCWRYIQQPLGIFEPKGRKLLENHLEGKMDYEEFSKRAVALWQGLKIRDLEEIVNRIPLRKGARETLVYFRENSYKVCAVSSGFDIWKSVFANKYGFIFDDFLANHLVINSNGLLTGEIEMRVTDDTAGKNKGDQLGNLAKKYGFDVCETIMVGDGLGDINAFKVAGLAFAAWPANEKVAEAADHVLDGESLECLLKFFDYGKYIGTGRD